jgi:hypothetical protein
MKRGVIAGMLLSLAFAVPAFAAESKVQPKVAEPQLQETRTQVLKNLDQRITKLQQEKACVKAAKTDGEINNCTANQGMSFGKRGKKGERGKVPIPPAAPDPDVKE